VTDGDRLDAWRDALAGGVAAGEVLGVVRDEIAASWERSSRTGLRPDRFEVPRDPDIELTRCWSGPIVPSSTSSPTTSSRRGSVQDGSDE
jgi:hypothetical protein